MMALNAALALLLGTLGGWAWWTFDQEIIGASLVGSAAVVLIFRISFVMFAVRILIPLAAALAAAYGYSVVQEWDVIASLRAALEAANSEAGLFVEVFNGTVSTIYALLVAFMVFNAMSDHSDINTSLEKEAMHLDSMSQLLPVLHDGVSSNVVSVRRLHELLRSYADNVLSKSFTKSGMMSENQAIIDALFEQVYRLKVEDENDRIALSGLFRRLDELEALRAHRISAMKARPSPFLTILLILLSVAVVLPFYLPMPGTAPLAPIAIGALTFCTTFLFVMLMDMVSHFHGYWIVDREPFAVVRDRIARRLQDLDTQYVEGDGAASQQAA